MFNQTLSQIPPLHSGPDVVNSIIEIPKGSRNKYELDKDTGLFTLDRYLYCSSRYPGDYGFIPNTLAEDEDPLDILVMVSEPSFAGCLVRARVIGVFEMTDKGKADNKLLGVVDSDPLCAEYTELSDLPSHFLKEVEHFFQTYKQLENIEVKANGWHDKKHALNLVSRAVERFNK